MALRTAAGLLFVFLLRFGGVRSETVIHHFSRAGENSTLPCERLSHHGPSCSAVNWYYLKTSSSRSIPKVSEGNVKDSRLTLNPDCSLSVQKVSKEDSGLFLCWQTGVRGSDTNVYLSVLTVSTATPEPISANFTLHSTEGTTPEPRENGDQPGTTGWSWFLLLKTLGWTPLIITTVVVSICTRDAQRPKSNRKRVPDYENETNL